MDSAVVSPPYLAGPLRLEPFRALRLRPSRVGDPASARLYARPYRCVGERVRSWLSRGDLIEDDSPALYVHEYTDNGLTIRGVVGCLDLAHPASSSAGAAVVPHEGVHPPQVSVLASRLEQMGLHPAPILLAQETPGEARSLIDRETARRPSWTFDDRGGQRHRVWAVRDPQAIASLNASWADSRALIADGHHRYAAYLRALDEHPATAAGTGLAMLVDQASTPLHLGAIHRVLHGVAYDDVVRAVKALDLEWHEVHRAEALDLLGPHHLVATDGRSWADVRLPGTTAATDVEYLHSEVVGALRKAPQHVGYHHSVEDALRRTRRGRDTAVLLPAPTIDQVWATVTQDRLLPEKATSFQPKPHPGVLMLSWHDGPSGP